MTGASSTSWRSEQLGERRRRCWRRARRRRPSRAGGRSIARKARMLARLVLGDRRRRRRRQNPAKSSSDSPRGHQRQHQPLPRRRQVAQPDRAHGTALDVGAGLGQGRRRARRATPHVVTPAADAGSSNQVATRRPSTAPPLRAGGSSSRHADRVVAGRARPARRGPSARSAALRPIGPTTPTSAGDSEPGGPGMCPRSARSPTSA